MSIVKMSMNYMFVLKKAKRKSEVREISDLPKVMQHINERACGGTKVSAFRPVPFPLCHVLVLSDGGV